MYGYGARGDNVASGTHDPLFAKALVLSAGDRSVALVALDMGSVRKQSVRRIRQQIDAQVDVSEVLLMASHSHSTLTYSDFEVEGRPWYRRAEDLIAAAVVDAARSQETAALRVGYGEVDTCHNRREVLADGSVRMRWANREGVPTEPVDKTVAVLAVDRGDDALATVVSFACHPVVLGPENLEISADFPGAMNAAIERGGGGMSLFMPGAAGDINPFWDKTAPADGAFEQVERMGEEIARVALDARRRGEPVPVDQISTSSETVTLDSRWDFESAELRKAFDDAGAGTYFDYYRDRYLSERVAETTVVVLGRSVGLATFPGEFFVEHALRLKEHSNVPHTFFVGYTNGELGYFPTIRAAGQGGYGATESTVVEVGAGEKLVDRALIRLLELSGRLAAAPNF